MPFLKNFIKSLCLKVYGLFLFRNTVVPPNNYSEAHFRPDGATGSAIAEPVQRRCAPVSGGWARGACSRPASACGTALQHASPCRRCRCPGHAWEAPAKGDFVGCFSWSPGFCIVFKNLQHLFISQQLYAFSSWDDGSAWSSILLNRACRRFPVTEPATW